MKNKKAIKLFISILVAVVFLGMVVNFFGKNALLLNGMVNTLVNTAKEADGIEILDTRSDYGKLVGNGNGIQYYGAILVKASSEEDVQNLVEKLKGEYERVGYRLQTDRVVDAEYLPGVYYMVEDYVFEISEGCLYSVHFFNSYHEDSNLLDIKGH